MNIKNLSLIFLLSVSSSLCFSQNDSLASMVKKSSNLMFAFNGTLVQSGARIGLELPIKTGEISKFRNPGKEINFSKDLFITADLSWYHHPQFHDNFYLTSGILMRRTSPTGFFTEFSPEIGFSRTFLGGTTYQVNSNGEISIQKLAGYNYAFLSVGEGLGYDFSKIKSLPVLIFCKINLFSVFPYNSTVYIQPAMDIGLIYKPSDFLSLKIKSREIHK